MGAGLAAGAVNGTARVGAGIISTTLNVGWKVVKEITSIATIPLRKGNVVSRLFFLALYTLAALYLLVNYTSLLDAWIK